jgi:hypothetical protein
MKEEYTTTTASYLHTLRNLLLEEGFNLEDFIVAGGCCRDTILGVVPKDIDIFVNSANVHEWDLELFLYTLDKEGFTVIGPNDEPEDGEPYEGVEGNISTVYESNTGLIPLPLQFIITDGLKPFTGENLVIDRFDLNICEAWYDWTADQFKTTHAFRQAVVDKKVSVKDMWKDKHKCYDRAIRIARKIGYDGPFSKAGGIKREVIEPNPCREIPIKMG